MLAVWGALLGREPEAAPWRMAFHSRRSRLLRACCSVALGGAGPADSFTLG